MKKIAIILMLLTISSKLLGFIREICLSYFYGASDISDAYLIAQNIPAVIFAFIATGIATSYIPLISEIMQKKGVQLANRFTSNLINIVLIVCTIIVVLGLIYTEYLVKIFASGFTGETLKTAVFFTRITLFGIYFSGLSRILSGYLRINDRFIIPALTGIPFNLIIIVSIIISSMSNSILAFGVVAALASEVLFLIPFIYKKGYRYKFVLDRYDEYINKLIYLSLPIVLSVSVNEINVIVDRTLASKIVVGGISALNYANKLNLFVHGIFVISISTVLYPVISKMAAAANMAGLKKVLSESISGINLLVVPATVGMMIFAEPIVKMLFGRGAFDEPAVALTSSALFFYALGMVGYGLREVLSRAFYSLQDTKTPMINATIAVGLNIILNIILSRLMGISGLAFATSISALFCTLLLFISLRKKIGHFGLKDITLSFGKIVLASILMGIVAKLANEALFAHLSANLSLLASIGIGVVVYFGIIYFMKIKEVEEIILQIKKEIRKVMPQE